VFLRRCAAAAQSQLEMNQAASKSYKAASVELSKALKLYRQRLPEGQLVLFDQAQRAWEGYRRAACEFESSGVSGEEVLLGFNQQKLGDCVDESLTCECVSTANVLTMDTLGTGSESSGRTKFGSARRLAENRNTVREHRNKLDAPLAMAEPPNLLMPDQQAPQSGS
jgi:uncharacterized protein YecT (DUF1311 family)